MGEAGVPLTRAGGKQHRFRRAPNREAGRFQEGVLLPMVDQSGRLQRPGPVLDGNKGGAAGDPPMEPEPLREPRRKLIVSPPGRIGADRER